jgi:hypothetical protein
MVGRTEAAMTGGQHVSWDGSTLDVVAGNITINSGGIQIPLGSNVSGSRILLGSTALYSSTSGTASVDGSLFIASSCHIGSALDVEGHVGVTGDLNAFGYLKTWAPLEFNHSAIWWDNAQTTGSADLPLVRSPSNGNIYVRTGLANGTYNLAGGGTIVVEQGLVVNVTT